MHDQREDYAEPGSPPDPRFSLDKLIALALAIGHLCALLLVGHILNYSVR